METFTVREVAELMRVHPKSVYRWIANGTLPDDAVVRVGRTVRIKRRYVEALYNGMAA